VITGASAAINIYTPSVIGELVAVIQGMTGPGAGDTAVDLSLLNGPALKLFAMFMAQGKIRFKVYASY
jgi:hypothetical protein